MSENEAFVSAYKTLNQAQREAVDLIEGPVLVIAGPGTGKTQILTLRIANILRLTDTSPDSILALTFTESATQAMRDRLRRYIGRDAYRVNIHTFHGFAEQVISTYPDSFTRVIGGTVATDIERYELIESILESDTWRILRPTGKPDYYVQPILQQIGACKREYVSPYDVGSWIQQEEVRLKDMVRYHEKGAHKGKVRGEYNDLVRSIAKHKEFQLVYKYYESLLREKNIYDFDDMILETVNLLQTDEVLRIGLQERYQYILADEHQDVNESQNQILLQLAEYHERPNIFVVGDEKQAIYRFQGASLGNFLFFSDHFSDTTVIQLTENYRSGQSILDTSQRVIETEDEDLQKLRIPLEAVRVDRSSVDVREFSHVATEMYWVAQKVKEKISSGINPSEIAVILRTNKAVEEYAHYLRSTGITVSASADGAINNHPIVVSFRALLRVLVNPSNEYAVAEILHAPYWGLGANDIARIFSCREKGRRVLDVLYDDNFLNSIGVQEIDKVKKIVYVLEKVKSDTGVLPPHRLFEVILRESGWLKYIHNQDPIEGGRVVRRLYDTVTEVVQKSQVRTLSDLSQYFDLYEQYSIALQAPFISTETDAVSVLTAHKAKGLEYEIVFIPSATDNVWGGGKSSTNFSIPLTKTSQIDDQAKEDDNKRSFYVAMTRAKKELYITYHKKNQNGKENIVSRIVQPLFDDNLYDKKSIICMNEDIDLLDTMGAYDGRLAIDNVLLKDILCKRGLSPTSFNNYLSHPWTYFYRNVLRIPEIPTLSLQYGTAIHSVLEKAVKEYKSKGNKMSISDLSKHLHHILSRSSISENEHVQLHEKGISVLSTYVHVLFTHLETSSTSCVEKKLRVDFETADEVIPIIPLTGAIDRIDRDVSGKVIRVVDYKTGKTKSRNDILGYTKNSEGNYYRQLCFYAFLLTLQGEHNDDISYTLSFIEPDQKGNIREESFYITDKDIKNISEEIVRVGREIVTGSFLDIKCDKNKCSYCGWVDILR